MRLPLLRSPKCGGVYIDVDIAPGTINLKTLSCKATPLTLPLFGPMVRDLKGVRSILHLEPEIPVTKTEIDRAVAIQTERGNINNNFIVVQTDCIFMDPLINFIAGQLAQYEEGFWKASKDFIAAITGPGAILGVLPKILRIRDNVNEGEAVVIMNKNFVCTWPVEWITPDSEDQDWSPTKGK